MVDGLHRQQSFSAPGRNLEAENRQGPFQPVFFLEVSPAHARFFPCFLGEIEQPLAALERLRSPDRKLLQEDFDILERALLVFLQLHASEACSGLNG